MLMEIMLPAAERPSELQCRDLGVESEDWMEVEEKYILEQDFDADAATEVVVLINVFFWVARD